MKITFTEPGDAESNIDLLRALADANAQRGRSDRRITIEELSGNIHDGFHLEGADDFIITGVVEDPDQGPIPARMNLNLIASVEFHGL